MTKLPLPKHHLFVNRIGEKCAMLTIIDYAGRAESDNTHLWLCRCDCGNEKAIRGSNLKGEKTKSCGCKNHLGYATHGKTNTSEMHTWSSMKARCYNKKNPDYKNYGGRGITICDRWLGSDGFINFIKDMGDKPTPKHSVDRIDNNKGYSPENCRWATQLEQARNTRRNKFIIHNGIPYTITEASKHFSINQPSITKNLQNGLSFAEILKKFTAYKTSNSWRVKKRNV